MKTLAAPMLIAATLAGGWLPGADTQVRRGAPPLSKAQWLEDLRYFAKELPTRHKNLYHSTSREKFQHAVVCTRGGALATVRGRCAPGADPQRCCGLDR